MSAQDMPYHRVIATTSGPFKGSQWVAEPLGGVWIGAWSVVCRDADGGEDYLGPEDIPVFKVEGDGSFDLPELSKLGRECIEAHLADFRIAMGDVAAEYRRVT